MLLLNFLYQGNLFDINLQKRNIINTMNQYSYCLLNKDADFRNAIQSSDILLPDGIGICFFNYILYGKFPAKIAGADLHEHLLSRLNQTGGKCFYLGSTQDNLETIQKRNGHKYPNVSCDHYSPPFADRFSDSENETIVNKINAFDPDILWVGMTAPKQEKWVHQFASRLKVKTIASIGAVFDFYAGTYQRPSPFWIKMGLEWFIRMLQQPKRLWKRYILYGPYFFYLLAKQKWFLLFHKTSPST